MMEEPHGSARNFPRDSGKLLPPKRVRKLRMMGNAEERKDLHPASSEFGHVILLGPANGGKTETLKNLFRGRLSTQDVNLHTNELREYGIGHLRILDTPGLSYAGGNITRDAQIIASIKKYLDFDPILHNSIPSVVVLVTKFNDPGIQSPQSTFVNSLRAINLLNRRILSLDYCNLIVLLTHFMNMRKWVRDNPNPQIQIVRDLVRKYLNTSCHVVYGENECEGWGLPRMTLGHKLPTGDVYPGILIDIILEIMRRSGFQTSLFHDQSRRLDLLNYFELISGQNSRYKKAIEAINFANGIVPIVV